MSVEETAARMRRMYGADAALHATYNALSNAWRNPQAEAFWRAVWERLRGA